MISGGLAVQNATVSIYVDGALSALVILTPTGYYSMSYSVAESWAYYQLLRYGFKAWVFLATSSTFTFVYIAQSFTSTTSTSTTSTSTASSYRETTTV